MAKLLADEHIPKRIVDKLALLGHDIVSVRQRDTNKAGDAKDDRRVLEIAINEQRALIAFNTRDFRSLHSEYHWHWGVICCQDDPDRVRLAKKIDKSIKAKIRTSKRHGLRGTLIYVR
jgi:predicted nuclease of predicted toxin-antitoxin system